MRGLIAALILFLAVEAQATRIPTAILDYTTATPAQMAWMNQKFSFKINGSNPNNPAMSWAMYKDLKGLASTADYLAMKDFAASHGYDYEKMLLHSKVDFTSAIATAWSQMDKFDNFEGSKGVMRTADDITYTDLTATAYSGSVTWQNTIYVGYEEPFDQINLVLSTAGVGITRVWEYWNGSTWAALTVTDGTTSFASSGQVAFTPPSAWARKVVNGSRNKYFVRCRITAASTNPVTSSVKGDNWLRGGNNLCRGWSFTDANRVNVGTALEYNPTPPAGSAAKFPYQSHMSFWGSNHFKFNSAYIVGGKRAAMEYLANAITTQATASGYTGVMLDDGGIPGATEDGVAYTNTDFYDYTANTLEQEAIARFAELATALHAYQYSFLVGVNAKSHAFVANATMRPDFNVDEYNTSTTYTYSPGQFVYGDYASTDMAYDDYIPANNPTGAKGVLLFRDDANNGYMWAHADIPWDMANRGPLTALSKFLIAYNPNLYFSYHTNTSSYVYSETDQVILKNGSTVNLSVSPVPALADVKRWGTWFPAMGVDFGEPTGARNKTWALGADIGGGQNVYFREWSNAIVLHRPTLPNQITAALYNTYSTPIALGGTYYPLNADGTTGAGVTTISLRNNEGAILMKAPIGETSPTTHRSLIGRCAARIR